MKEIPSQNWNTFCQRLNEFERGATVDIHWIDRATKVQKEIALAAEFQDITFGRRDACNDRIMVRVGGEVGTHHEIVEPIHILLRELGNGGGFNAVAVEAEEGTTLLKFNPVIRSAWMEGVTAL
jgi:hypothetical protein